MARNDLTVALPAANPYSPNVSSVLPLSMQLAPARPRVAQGVTVPLAAVSGPAADPFADTGLHGIGSKVGNFIKLAAAQPTALTGMVNGVNNFGDGVENFIRGAVGAQTVEAARAERQAASDGGAHVAAVVSAAPSRAQAAVAAPAVAALPTLDRTDQTIADYAQAHGGKMSLRALASLSHSLAETSAAKTEAKTPRAVDLAGVEMLKLQQQLEDQRAKEIEAAPAEKRAALTASAVKEKQEMLMRILGPNRQTLSDYAQPADGS